MFSHTARHLNWRSGVAGGAGTLALAAALGFAGSSAAGARMVSHGSGFRWHGTTTTAVRSQAAGHRLRRGGGLVLRPDSSTVGWGGCGGGAETVFQANTTNLWAVGEDQRGDLAYGMATGTSPAITCLTGGGWEAAFQANTGNLWTVGQDAHGDWGTPMMAGTSPAIAALADGGYEVAFQGSNGDLWTAGPDGVTDSGVPMMAGTSPAITGRTGSGYTYVFQGSNGYLWGGSNGGHPSYQTLSVRSGTSPSITTLGNGTDAVAWQDSNGCLDIIVDGTGGSFTQCAWYVRAGSSPSITTLGQSNAYVVAFQDNWSGRLDTYHSGSGVVAFGSSPQIMDGTSPSVTAVPGGSWEVAIQGTNTDLLTVAPDYSYRDWGLGMMTGTSPSISG